MSGFDILKTVGQIAGLAGLSLGVFLLLFRDFFRQKLLQAVGRTQSYRLIRLFMFLTWSLAIFGISAWLLSGYLRPTAKGGSVSVSGGLRAGDGAQAPGGDANVTAGDGFNGASGGDVTLGPGEYRAGDAGAGAAGGDLNIKAGDAKFGLPTATPNQALQPTTPPRH